ncbi:MAG: hypothetical protein RIR62_1167 [Pseudomonadota bacterium]|jgi:hypothetical protein
MRRLSPADELAEIRAEIARLQRREATLEATILRDPAGCARGTFNLAEVTESRRATFDPALLPPEVQGDPRFWREEVTRQIAVIPMRPQPLPLRPGWPIRRAPQSVLPFH